MIIDIIRRDPPAASLEDNRKTFTGEDAIEEAAMALRRWFAAGLRVALALNQQSHGVRIENGDDIEEKLAQLLPH